MKIKPITSIDTALRIYYSCPEIGNSEMRELFGSIGNSTAAKYKEAVKQEQVNQNVKTMQYHTVNTRVAYEVWGIDVKDLEERRRKLKRLGLVPHEVVIKCPKKQESA